MESTSSQTAEGMALVQVLAQVLERLVASNAQAEKNLQPVTKFHALKAPAISILQYLERIQKYASCSTECFVFALIYIDRLIQRNNFILTDLNVHRVVITAVLLSAKFYDDSYYNNAYYAKVGGVPVAEMNGLELEFLFFVQFSLHVTPDVFARYRNELISHSNWNGFDQSTIKPIQAQYAQQTSCAFSQDSNIVYDVVSSTDKHYCMDVVSERENAWTQDIHASQISPSPPPSTTSVSPPSCDTQEKEALHMEHLKYYSAPARYSCLVPENLSQIRHRSHSLPVSTDPCVVPQHTPTQSQMIRIDPYRRVVVTQEDPLFQYTHQVINREMESIRPSCLSVTISPNTSSPRFVDTIVSSNS